MYCYMPESEYANGAGKVMEHVYVMCQSIGRKLESNECVHHIDHNRANNDISNLMLMTNSEHAKLHAEEKYGPPQVRNCDNCGEEVYGRIRYLKKYCSYTCAGAASRRLNITKEELEKLVWEMPTSRLSKILGVSDVAIAKRCKKLGITKPPRGYWEKIKRQQKDKF